MNRKSRQDSSLWPKAWRSRLVWLAGSAALAAGIIGAAVVTVADADTPDGPAVETVADPADAVEPTDSEGQTDPDIPDESVDPDEPTGTTDPDEPPDPEGPDSPGNHNTTATSEKTVTETRRILQPRVAEPDTEEPDVNNSDESNGEGFILGEQQTEVPEPESFVLP